MCNITKWIALIGLAYSTVENKSVKEKMSFAFSSHLIFHECCTLRSETKQVHLPME